MRVTTLRAARGQRGLGFAAAAGLVLGMTACGHTHVVGADAPSERTITVNAPNPTPNHTLPPLGKLDASEYRLLATDLENGYAVDFSATGHLSERQYRQIAGAGSPLVLPSGLVSAYRVRYVARTGVPELHRVDSVVAVFRSIRSAVNAQTRVKASLLDALRRYRVTLIHVPGAMSQKAGYSYPLRVEFGQRLLVTIIVYRIHNVACLMIVHSTSAHDISRMVIAAQRHAERITLSG